MILTNDQKVTETLSLIYGQNFCPIAYIIKSDEPPGWNSATEATTEDEKLMYQLPLNGVTFDQDNEQVFSLIQLAVVQRVAASWIHEAIAAWDGHGAMFALQAHYEGKAKLDVCQVATGSRHTRLFQQVDHDF